MHASPQPPENDKNINGWRASFEPIASSSDDWFVVYRIKSNILAISEPHYYQGNFSYLVIGEHCALMIDAGASAKHDITAVIAKLTNKPVAMLPTHLHFDHLGGLDRFSRVWLADTPTLAAFKQYDGSYRVPTEYTFGYFEKLGPAIIKPDRLIPLDSVIDLGGVTLKVAYAPGHSPDGIVVYDQTDNVLFTGDYLYPKRLYSSNTTAYAAATKRIFPLTNEDTLLFGAHGNNGPDGEVPVMPRVYLQDLNNFFSRLANKETQGKHFSKKDSGIKSAWLYTVNNKISFLENIIWTDGTTFKH